jgi:hypothetical protein
VKLGDKRIGFVASELATSLTLRETHWTTSVSKICMAGSIEQLHEFL